MTRGISEESFIKEFSESLKNGNASFFIGSGISRKAQYVGWKDVLKLKLILNKRCFQFVKVLFMMI